MSSAYHGPFAQSGIGMCQLCYRPCAVPVQPVVVMKRTVSSQAVCGVNDGSAQCRAWIERSSVLPDRPAHSGHFVGQRDRRQWDYTGPWAPPVVGHSAIHTRMLAHCDAEKNAGGVHFITQVRSALRAPPDAANSAPLSL